MGFQCPWNQGFVNIRGEGDEFRDSGQGSTCRIRACAATVMVNQSWSTCRRH